MPEFSALIHRSAATSALGLFALAVTGCSAVVSTTNTTADAVHTVSHGVSVSSLSSTNVSSGKPEEATSARTRAFVENQHLALQREAAAGGGEHIDALARLMADAGPQNTQSAELGAWMQANYAELFSAGTSADQLVSRIERHAG